jgi:hypothetical protein
MTIHFSVRATAKANFDLMGWRAKGVKAIGLYPPGLLHHSQKSR